MTAPNFPWQALAEEVTRVTDMRSAFDWILQSIAESGADDAADWADTIREIRAREERFLQFVVDTVSMLHAQGVFTAATMAEDGE